MIFSEEFKAEISAIIKMAVREELMLLKNSIGDIGSSQDEMLNIKQAAEFLDRPVSTLYSLVSQGTIPYNKPGKRLYFMKNELIEWVRKSRRQTKDEIAIEADNILTKKSP